MTFVICHYVLKGIKIIITYYLHLPQHKVELVDVSSDPLGGVGGQLSPDPGAQHPLDLGRVGGHLLQTGQHLLLLSDPLLPGELHLDLVQAAAQLLPRPRDLGVETLQRLPDLENTLIQANQVGRQVDKVRVVLVYQLDHARPQNLEVNPEIIPEHVQAGPALPHADLDEEVVHGEVWLEEVPLGDGQTLGAGGDDALEAASGRGRARLHDGVLRLTRVLGGSDHQSATLCNHQNGFVG